MKEIIEKLKDKPFILILGEFHQVIGPNLVLSSTDISDTDFLQRIVDDSMNTDAKYVILDFDEFYGQTCKIEIMDRSARGGFQLYNMIFLRSAELPLIPINYLKRIGDMFKEIGTDTILKNDLQAFADFFAKIFALYTTKQEILPSEEFNLKVRNDLTAIQGFLDLILEEKKKDSFDEDQVIRFIIMMKSCSNNIQNALDEFFSNE